MDIVENLSTLITNDSTRLISHYSSNIIIPETTCLCLTP
jgi:hypothetical protein